MREEYNSRSSAVNFMFPTLYRMQAKVKKRMNKGLPNNFRHAEFISKRYYELYFQDSSMKPVGMNPEDARFKFHDEEISLAEKRIIQEKSWHIQM